MRRVSYPVIAKPDLQPPFKQKHPYDYAQNFCALGLRYRLLS